MKLAILTLAFVIVLSNLSFGQCCAGGSGSPVAGGTSQGVLLKNQLELNTNFQFIKSDKFFTGNKPDTAKYFDEFSSSYQYSRLAYGVTPEFTMSVEMGYYYNKQETGLNNDPTRTYKSKGVGDLIIFPRYKILNYCTGKTTNEITLGLGYKIPLGKYNDSTGRIEPFSGDTYYITNPQSVQMTSGAQDIIFYGFLFRGYTAKKFRVFANMMYVKKGWNPLGEKMGDFASIGLFAGKTFFNHLGTTLQLRGEWVDKMKLNENILLYAYPNYDPSATGYKKMFVTPQISYSINNFTVYTFCDIPVYQNVVKTQVVTKYQFMAGLSYKLMAFSSNSKKANQGEYYCPMHPEIRSTLKTTCRKCGMNLIKAEKK
ncbi:MAG: heavy metal-binding domain-containing protein [Bacteroidota bacterium]